MWDPFNPKGGPTSVATVYTYDEAGRLDTRTYPNGVKTTWTFDDRDRLLSIVHEDDMQNVIASFTYEHPKAAVGEPHKITREDGSYVVLGYDEALQLETEAYYDDMGVLQRTITYTYDDAGNRTSRTDESGTYDYIADEDAKYLLASIDGPGGDDSMFMYDDGGRLKVMTRERRAIRVRTQRRWTGDQRDENRPNGHHIDERL
ncbi:MAG: RHS repeat domain-containing protein [Pirellulales bacterium]